MITAKDKKVTHASQSRASGLGKLPTRKARKPRGENAENLLIFYCGFKTVLTDQVRANNHKYNEKAKIYNIIIMKKGISLSLKFLFFQSYGSSFMKYSLVKGFTYVTPTFGSKP